MIQGPIPQIRFPCIWDLLMFAKNVICVFNGGLNECKDQFQITLAGSSWLNNARLNPIQFVLDCSKYS